MAERYSIITEIRNVARNSMPQGSRMFLFGSQARGDADESSDWDILILLDKERVKNADFDAVAYPIVELGWRLGIEIMHHLFFSPRVNRWHNCKCLRHRGYGHLGFSLHLE